MDPRTTGSLLWGLVSLLAFLVLLQGYVLLTDAAVGVAVAAVVALVVGAAGATTAHLARDWLRRRAR